MCWAAHQPVPHTPTPRGRSRVAMRSDAAAVYRDLGRFAPFGSPPTRAAPFGSPPTRRAPFGSPPTRPAPFGSPPTRPPEERPFGSPPARLPAARRTVVASAPSGSASAARASAERYEFVPE